MRTAQTILLAHLCLLVRALLARSLTRHATRDKHAHVDIHTFFVCVRRSRSSFVRAHTCDMHTDTIALCGGRSPTSPNSQPKKKNATRIEPNSVRKPNPPATRASSAYQFRIVYVMSHRRRRALWEPSTVRPTDGRRPSGPTIPFNQPVCCRRGRRCSMSRAANEAFS